MSNTETRSINDAQRIVIAFYTLLNQRNFDAAYQHLSPAMRTTKYNDDAAYFAAGYNNTVSIQSVSCDIVHQDNAAALCDINYIDEFKEYQHPLLTPIMGADLQAPETIAAIDKFKEFMRNDLLVPTEAIAKIADHFYVERNSVENCLWLVNKADHLKDERLFPFTIEKTRNYRRAECINTSNGWQINDIKHKP